MISGEGHHEFSSVGFGLKGLKINVARVDWLHVLYAYELEKFIEILRYIFTDC